MTVHESRAEGSGRLTVFTVGGVEYAVRGRVLRSLPAPDPLPARLDHAGAAFPVVDLAEVAGTEAGGEGASLVFLVAEEAEGRVVLRALTGAEPHGAESFDPGEVQPVPALYPAEERRRWSGLLPRPDGRVVVLLDLAGLPERAAQAAGGN